MFAAASVGARAQETSRKGLQLRDLPASVQKTVQDNLKGAAIRRIGREKEEGVDQYEIETVFNGHARDFNVDIAGRLLVVEETTTLDAIPVAARTAILKRVGGGKLTTVETVARSGQPLRYEAAYRDASGKRHEMLVDPDGRQAKD